MYPFDSRTPSLDILHQRQGRCEIIRPEPGTAEETKIIICIVHGPGEQLGWCTNEYIAEPGARVLCKGGTPEHSESGSPRGAHKFE